VKWKGTEENWKREEGEAEGRAGKGKAGQERERETTPKIQSDLRLCAPPVYSAIFSFFGGRDWVPYALFN